MILDWYKFMDTCFGFDQMAQIELIVGQILLDKTTIGEDYRGFVFNIVGKAGSGKTTLLNVLKDIFEVNHIGHVKIIQECGPDEIEPEDGVIIFTASNKEPSDDYVKDHIWTVKLWRTTGKRLGFDDYRACVFTMTEMAREIGDECMNRAIEYRLWNMNHM